MGGVLLGTAVVVGAAAYFGLKIFASFLNSRQSSWEASAAGLGLSVDRSAAGIYKPLTGERNGRKLVVSYYSVVRDEDSFDDHAAAEVALQHAVPFSFEICKTEMWIKRLAEDLNFRDPDTGHKIFDRAFDSSASDISSLNFLLNVEMLDGQTPTLLTDLRLTAKRFFRVKVTDKSVTVGSEADLSDAKQIEPAIERALYLADRVETACRKLQQAGSRHT